MFTRIEVFVTKSSEFGRWIPWCGDNHTAHCHTIVHKIPKSRLIVIELSTCTHTFWRPQSYKMKTDKFSRAMILSMVASINTPRPADRILKRTKIIETLVL